MRGEFHHSKNGCLPDILENKLSGSALRILRCISEEFFSDQFSVSDLEELVVIKEKSFQYLIDNGIIKKVAPETAMFELNYNHPVVVAHSAKLSDIMEQD